MPQNQNEFPQSMLTSRDIFGDDIDDEDIQGNEIKPLLRYGIAGLVGGVIGAGIAHQNNLGPGGAELIPMAGAGVGILVFRVKESIVKVWDEFTYIAGWN